MAALDALGRMKVVLNSDVLYHRGTLVRGELGRGLRELFVACAAKGHEVVIPLTTRLEFDRHQSEQVVAERRRLAEAYAMLNRYEVEFAESDPAAVVVAPDLIALIAESGVTVEEWPPENGDFVDAHRRASMREAPHPPESKSDEMRDLVIWAQAVRLARADADGALLISRDEVHVHERGDEEASECGLVRVRSVEEALEFFEVRTPAGRMIEDLLGRVWDGLRAEDDGLPLAVMVKSVTNATFRQGEAGLAAASASIKGSAAGDVVEGDVSFELGAGVITRAGLSNLKIGGADREGVTADLDVPSGLEPEAQADDDLEALREVLEG
ncbi:MAG: hypothetical protein ACXVFF_14140 [Gaiellaceae bacterium]